MAKRKSKKIKTKGAKPVPCGGEPPDPGYQLEQGCLAKDRYEQSRWQNYDKLQSLVEQPDIRKQLYELADKGLKEAEKRKKGKRWPLFYRKKTDVSKDLPQAACILLMFHDDFQENQLITPELRVEYSEAISELREQMAYYRGVEQEIDLFTICMVYLRQQLPAEKRKETEDDADAKQNKLTEQQELLSDSLQARKWDELDQLDRYLAERYAQWQEDLERDKKARFPRSRDIENQIKKHPGIKLELKLTHQGICNRLKKLTKEGFIENYPYDRHAKRKTKETPCDPDYIDDMVDKGKARPLT